MIGMTWRCGEWYSMKIWRFDAQKPSVKLFPAFGGGRRNRFDREMLLWCDENESGFKGAFTHMRLADVVAKIHLWRDLCFLIDRRSAGNFFALKMLVMQALLAALVLECICWEITDELIRAM